jgi:hypothetical protein
LATNNLVPKLVIAGAATRQNGILVFSQPFNSHIIACSDIIKNKKLETVSAWRNMLGAFDPSLASLSVDELADLIALLVFQFEAMKVIL